MLNNGVDKESEEVLLKYLKQIIRKIMKEIEDNTIAISDVYMICNIIECSSAVMNITSLIICVWTD